MINPGGIAEPLAVDFFLEYQLLHPHPTRCSDAADLNLVAWDPHLVSCCPGGSDGSRSVGNRMAVALLLTSSVRLKGVCSCLHIEHPWRLPPVGVLSGPLFLSPHSSF